MKYFILVFLFIANIAFAQKVDVKTYIPPKALTYLPVMNSEVRTYFNDTPIPQYFGGLVEQESCISLKHSRCWDPSSQLLSARERGAGLGQITKAFREDGSIRFDSLSDLRKAHMQDLKDLSWSNVVSRPDLQIRSILLMSKDNYKIFFAVNDVVERFKMMDAAYNAGPNSVKKRRLRCGLTKDCNPQTWDENVGSMQVLSLKPIYGTRSPQFINDEHVDMIFNIRMNKYKPYLDSN